MEVSRNIEVTYEIKLRGEILSSQDRVSQELTSRFQHIHAIAEKSTYLNPLKLFDVKS